MLQLMSIKAAEKKRCKRGGESMNNQVVVNEDRISELPEALILQILSFLPTKSALTTSVLSKQWQFLWKMMPELKFDYCDHKDEVGIFSKNVCSSLLSNTVPVLESLHLKFHPDNCSGVDFKILIKTAKARHARKLVLEAGYSNCYKIPQSLYNNEILETLILKACVAIKKPKKVCLKSLKTLHLHAVNITDRAWVLKFLSGCHNLEDLLVCLYPQSSVTTLTIAHPTLQRLSVYNKRAPSHKWGCFIDAPDLKYFCIEGDHGFCRFRMSNKVTKLVEANISEVYIGYIVIEKVLVSLTSVERLSLKLLPNQIPTASTFHQLVHLELFTCRGLRWDLLIFMLDSSPKLQFLKLIHEPQIFLSWKNAKKRHMGIFSMAHGKWKQPKNVPKCLLFHLETFVSKCYCESLVEDEKEVMKYILRNATSLKRAIFSSKHITVDDRLELESVVRASNSCQFLFNSNM